jgi:drug/metabolite transporter (DMT)-like permease
MSKERLSFRVILAYLTVFIVWGSTYLAIRVGVESLPPALFAGVRFVMAGLLMLAFGKLKGHPLPDRRGLIDLSIIGILLLVGGNLLVVWAEKTIPSGLAALIIALVPLFMSSIDSFVPKGQTLSPIGWLGIFVGIIGTFILVSPGLGLTEGEYLNPLGIGGLILACLFWSIGSVYSRHHYVEGNIFVNSGVQNLVPGIMLVIIGLAVGEVSDVHITTRGMLALGYLIVFGSIIGYTSYVYLLRHQPPAKASTYAYVNPIVAILLGWSILDEPISLRTIISAAIILAGVGIVQISKMKSK